MARKGWFGRLVDNVEKIFKSEPPQREYTPPPPPPERIPPGGGRMPPSPPPEDEDEVFSSDDDIRDRVKLTKISFFSDVVGFGRRASDRNVDNSDDIDEMEDALDRENRTEAQWSELASLAAKAHHALDRTGDAGELAIYLPYSFLWYHYLPGNEKWTCTS